MSLSPNAILILLAIGATVALANVLGVVWQPIFWAIVIGILFHPLMKWIDSRLSGRPSLAAALTVLAIFVFVQIPALLLGSMVIREGVSLYTRIQSGAVDPGAELLRLENLFQPELGQLMTGIGIDLGAITEKLQSAILRSSEFVLSLFLSAGQNAAAFLINFFLMLYLLFFILRDGEDMYRQVFRAEPLPTNQKQLLFKKFADVSIATLKGTFIVGLVQGALGGLIFAVLGINGAVFWGAVMAMVSVLPAVGTALIWVPAAVILIVGGAWIKGLILSAFGTFVISMSDNGLAANGSGSPDEDARLLGALLHLGRAQCPWHQRLRLGTCGRRAVYGGLATH
ncbi:MAG: AI-2E family transporter [Mesorhizobium sp.]|nr:AI-2E family transporter [Mesorhizobium sp.]TIL60840.1 MAG: AI-2E family transporter [Mesorhizobium sp.]TIM45140.1 MAG: AI-2E family transporter [Mesorhizobium sp.]